MPACDADCPDGCGGYRRITVDEDTILARLLALNGEQAGTA